MCHRTSKKLQNTKFFCSAQGKNFLKKNFAAKRFVSKEKPRQQSVLTPSPTGKSKGKNARANRTRQEYFIIFS